MRDIAKLGNTSKRPDYDSIFGDDEYAARKEKVRHQKKSYWEKLATPSPRYMQRETDEPPRKKAKVCISHKFCPPRIDQLAIPTTPRMEGVLTDFHNTLEPERIVRIVKLIHINQQPKPIRHTVKRKRKHQPKRLKKHKKKMLEKEWLDRQTDVSAQLIMDFLGSRVAYTPNYKQVILSLGLMKALRQKTHHRLLREHLLKFCEQVAIISDREWEPYQHFEDIESESEEDLIPEEDKKHVFYRIESTFSMSVESEMEEADETPIAINEEDFGFIGNVNIVAGRYSGQDTIYEDIEEEDAIDHAAAIKEEQENEDEPKELDDEEGEKLAQVNEQEEEDIEAMKVMMKQKEKEAKEGYEEEAEQLEDLSPEEAAAKKNSSGEPEEVSDVNKVDAEDELEAKEEEETAKGEETIDKTEEETIKEGGEIIDKTGEETIKEGERANEEEGGAIKEVEGAIEGDEEAIKEDGEDESSVAEVKPESGEEDLEEAVKVENEEEEREDEEKAAESEKEAVKEEVEKDEENEAIKSEKEDAIEDSKKDSIKETSPTEEGEGGEEEGEGGEEEGEGGEEEGEGGEEEGEEDGKGGEEEGEGGEEKGEVREEELESVAGFYVPSPEEEDDKESPSMDKDAGLHKEEGQDILLDKMGEDDEKVIELIDDQGNKMKMKVKDLKSKDGTIVIPEEMAVVEKIKVKVLPEHPKGTASYVAYRVYSSWLEEFGHNIQTYSTCLRTFRDVIARAHSEKDTSASQHTPAIREVLLNWSSYLAETMQFESTMKAYFKGKAVSRCNKCSDIYNMYNLPTDEEHELPAELRAALKHTAHWKALLANAERHCQLFTTVLQSASFESSHISVDIQDMTSLMSTDESTYLLELLEDEDSLDGCSRCRDFK